MPGEGDMGLTLTMVDSEFMSFYHQARSYIFACESSTVVLSGNINFSTILLLGG